MSETNTDEIKFYAILLLRGFKTYNSLANSMSGCTSCSHDSDGTR